MSEGTGRVVVGHDGSSHAAQAVRWAANYARSTGFALVVVRGWSISSAPRPASQTVGYIPPIEDFAAAVLADLESDVARDLGDGVAGLDLSYAVPRSAAANALIDTAAGAELLVVGARGLGGFRGLALGSVSDQCVRHSPCPVVVVRGDHTVGTDRVAEDRALTGDD